jgi:serine/threonine-protein kinase RsbW
MSGEETLSFELEMPADPKYVSLARLLAGSIARRLNFAEESIDDLKIAISEMCTNAIIHGGDGERNKPPVKVRYLAGKDRLTVEVADQGPGFDPGCILERERRDLLDKGFGIPLIRSLVDDFQCDSEPGRGTVVRITKYLHPDGEGS